MRASNEVEAGRRQASPGINRDLRWTMCAALFGVVAIVSIAQDRQQAANPGDDSVATANAIAGVRSQSSDPSSAQAATAQDQRRKQIADESTQLLSMAIALKAEVDKTNKDVLSINVIRKADEIEKLAHTVKQKLKQGAGPG